jgi:protein-tyrosine phosphatase
LAAVLFVCTGNICRSPTAEVIFHTLLVRQRLTGRIQTDSAGTHDYQLGQPADPRAVRAAQRRGYRIGQRAARQIEREDFARFDWIIAMDRGHLRELDELRPATYAGRLALLLDFVPELGLRDVPDPYHGVEADFERALDLIECAVGPLLAAVRAELPAA